MKDFIITLKSNSSEKGSLVAIEENKLIPFNIRRVYYTYDVPINSKRGFHAHIKTDQLIWCPYGEIEVTMDDGNERKIFILDSPEKAILIMRGYWHEMKWLKEGSILCAVASEIYLESDYIRNYDEFIEFVKGGKWNESEF